MFGLKLLLDLATLPPLRYTPLNLSAFAFPSRMEFASMRRAFLFVLFVSALVLLWNTTAAVAATARAERPTYVLGQKWIRSDGAYELVRFEADRYVFAARPGQEIVLTKDLAIARVVQAHQVVEFDPPIRLGWPLEVGKWGTSLGFWRTPDFTSGVSARLDWSVDAYEDVRTPAGTFKAFRISISTTPTQTHVQQRWPGYTGKVWYAPDARQFVKAEGRAEIGLSDYQVIALDRPVPAPPPVAAPAPEGRAPPSIAVRFPEDGARLDSPSTVVAAVITSPRGIAQVAVRLNEAVVHQQREQPPRASVLLTVPVALQEGVNTIEVSASDAEGVSQRFVRKVTYGPPAAATGTVKAPPPSRERWAVVIGIGKYDRPEIPPLRYSATDAEKFYELLTTQAGFKKDRVLLLTDKTERRPTLRNMKWALGTFLARSAGKDDLVIIFYAGHGAPEIDPRGIESDGLAKYLVPIDADSDDLYATGFPMDELQTIFARIEAEQVVVFLDACYSGAAGGRTFASKRTRASRVDDLFLERLTRSKGRVVVTASRASEVSLELPELGHGIFTHYLIQGFRGTADLDRDGIVSLQELYQYVEQQVIRKSRAVGGNQHPVMKGEVEGILPLVKVGSR